MTMARAAAGAPGAFPSLGDGSAPPPLDLPYDADAGRARSRTLEDLHQVLQSFFITERSAALHAHYSLGHSSCLAESHR